MDTNQYPGSGRLKMRLMRSTERSTVQVSTFIPTTQRTRLITLVIHQKGTLSGTGILPATRFGHLTSSRIKNSRSATSSYSHLIPHLRMQLAIPKAYLQNLPYKRTLHLWMPSLIRTAQVCTSHSMDRGTAYHQQGSRWSKCHL